MYTVFDGSNKSSWPLPTNTNLMNFSILREFEARIGFRRFSVKYVLEGVEKYTVNGNVFHVQPGQYLLANSFCEGHVEINSEKPVTGICIDVSPDLISNAVASYVCPGDAHPDPALDRFLNSPGFLESTYSDTETLVGQTMGKLGKVLRHDPFGEHEFGDDFYFNLAENIVADHAQVFQQMKAIQVLKDTTRKDLYRKVHKARLFIDEHYALSVNMSEVAREAALSEYHFYRLFKTVYGITPNQYLVSKRMEKAHALLKTGHGPVAFIAVQVGFPDVYSFSKSFKKHFGINPSQVFARN